MASATVRIEAVSVLSRSPLEHPADIVVEPPRNGYLRVHLSLSELAADAVILTADIVPTNSEVGGVRINHP